MFTGDIKRAGGSFSHKLEFCFLQLVVFPCIRLKGLKPFGVGFTCQTRKLCKLITLTEDSNKARFNYECNIQ